MKDLLKYGIAMLVIAFGFTACNDDDDDTVFGPKSNAEGTHVGVVTQGNVVIPSTGTSFDITFQRNNGTDALTVPVTLNTGSQGIFSAPANINFAAGDTLTTLTVTVSDKVEMFKNYFLEVVVDQNYTQQYDEDVTAPRAMLTVVKEDYKVVATGSYLSWWTEEEEDAELEYSEILDSYRFNKQTSGEFTFEFSVGDVVTDEEDDLYGMQPITFSDNFISVGCVTSADWAHPSYGMVTMRGFENSDAPSYYDPENKTYYFDIQWRVSAGTFGDYYDSFTVK